MTRAFEDRRRVWHGPFMRLTSLKTRRRARTGCTHRRLHQFIFTLTAWKEELG